jgi:small subunit ribosomal protein S14
MAKLSSVNKNNRRRALVKKYAGKWARLKAIANDMSKPADERFTARLKMAKMPRNSHPTRVRNRCALTGRARGNYRKFGISRLMLRELASQGLIPGVTKSSW